MATKYPTNKKRTNYARLSRAIIDLSPDVLRELLKRQVSPNDILSEIRKIPAELTKVINKEQWGYIKNAAAKGTYVKQFDITLLCLVLRILSVRDLIRKLETSFPYQTLHTSIQSCSALSSDQKTKLSQFDLAIINKNTSYTHCKDELLWKLYTHLSAAINPNLTHPSLPWGSANMPDSAHTTVGDDIERLRHIRNKTYGHLNSSEISDTEFDSCWEELERIIDRMDQELPGHKFKASLDKMKTKKWQKELKETQSSVAEIQGGLAETQGEVVKIQDNVAGVQGEVTEILYSISKTQVVVAGIQGDVEEIEDSVAETQDCVAVLQDEVTELQNNASRTQVDVAGIQGNVAGIQVNVEEMQDSVAETQDSVAVLQDEVTEILYSISKTQVDMAGIQVDVAGIQGNVAGIQGHVGEIQDSVAETQGNVAVLQDEVTEIRDNVSRTQVDVAGIQDDVAELQDEVAELKETAISDEVRCYKENTKLQIERHRDDKTFVITDAVSKGIEILTKHGILIYSGLPGQGKTKNALEVMKQLQERNPGWQFIELNEIRKWKELIDPKVPSVVLLNDVIGKTNIDQALINDGDNHFPNILASVEKGKVRIIMTVRKILLNKNMLKLEQYKLFDAKHTIDLTSVEFHLNISIKKKILQKHCENNNIVICSSWVEYFVLQDRTHEKSVVIIWETIDRIVKTDPILGFPFSCYHFCCKRKYTRLGEKFFEKPTHYLIEEIKSLMKSGSTELENVQFFTMVYMVLNNGIFDGKFNDKIFSRIITFLEISTPKKRVIDEAITELLGRYILRNSKSQYEFKHQTILESVCVCFKEYDPHLLLELCSEEFIVEFVRPYNFQETEGEVVCKVDKEVYNAVVNRFLYGSKHGNDKFKKFRWWIFHPFMNDKEFVDCFVSFIQSTKNDQNNKLDIEEMFEIACQYWEYTQILDALYPLLTNELKRRTRLTPTSNFYIFLWQLDHGLYHNSGIRHISYFYLFISLTYHRDFALNELFREFRIHSCNELRVFFKEVAKH